MTSKLKSVLKISAFANAVSREKLELCPYLTTGIDGHLNAAQWNALLEKTVKTMDARSENLRLEKLIRLINTLIKP